MGWGWKWGGEAELEGEEKKTAPPPLIRKQKMRGGRVKKLWRRKDKAAWNINKVRRRKRRSRRSKEEEAEDNDEKGVNNYNKMTAAATTLMNELSNVLMRKKNMRFRPARTL